MANGWSVDHYLLFDGRPFVEATLDGGLNEVEERLYIHLGQRLIATVSGLDVSHVISDHIGFPLAVADEQGGILWYASHQAFGEVGTVHEGTSAADPLRRFPGQWRPDPVLFSVPTNLYYNGHRWYSPAWGRYTQADPLGKPFAIKDALFAYAGSSPLRFIDPLGLECESCCQSPEAIAEDLRTIKQAINLKLLAYLSTTFKIQTKCGQFNSLVEDAIRNAPAKCHDQRAVTSKRRALFAKKEPYHMAVIIKPCDKESWEKDGIILDPWPSAILYEFSWNNWRPGILRFEPYLEYNDIQVGECLEERP